METVLVAVVISLCACSAQASIQPLGVLGREMPDQVHFLPDGTLLQVLSERLEIIDPKTREVLHEFGHAERLREVTLSPTGEWLATVERMGTSRTKQSIRIWNVSTRQKVSEWDVPKRVWEMAFSAADGLLAVAHGDEVHLWNWQDAEHLGKLEDERRPWNDCYVRYHGSGHSRTCGGGPSTLSLAFSPDGHYLIVGSKRDDAEVWDVSTHLIVAHLEGHADWVSEVTYSPDGRWIASAEPRSNRVFLWDGQSFERVQRLSYGSGAVEQLTFGQGQRLFIVQDSFSISQDSPYDDAIYVLDLQTNELVQEFGDELVFLEHASLSPDGTQAVLQYHDGLVVWDLLRSARTHRWLDYDTGSGALSPDGKTYVTRSGTTIKLWDIPSLSLRKAILLQEGFVRRVAVSPDSRSFAVDHDPWIEIRDIHSGEIRSKVPNSYGSTPFVFSSDSQHVAVGDSRTITIYDVEHPERYHRLEAGVDSSFAQIALSTGLAYVAATDGDRNLHVWHRQGEEYVHRHSVPLPSDSYWELVFEPLASYARPRLLAANQHQIQVWDVTGEAPRVVMDFDGLRYPLRFVHDGHYLFAQQREESALQIIDWRNKQTINHPPIPGYFDVSHDGSALLTWGRGDKVWDVRPLIHPKPQLWGQIKQTALLPSYPNPFNPETWIPYQLAEDADVQIRIHDVTGRLVRKLVLGPQSAGSHISRERAAYWDGRNQAGEEVGSGVYFGTLHVGQFTSTQRMCVVR